MKTTILGIPRVWVIAVNAFFFILINQHAYSQTSEADSATTHDVVRRVRFTGNKFVKDRVLENLIRTKTNREFLGIPRFTPWYFFWRVTKGGVGEAPSLLNRETVSNDMERISLYYQSLGFRNVSVDTTIVEYRKNKVEVSFIIDEGEPSQIQTIAYSGFPFNNDPELRRRFFIQSKLTRQGINDSTFTVNRQFNAQELKDEQLRIIEFLKNNGYASVERDSVIAFVKPAPENPLNLDVLFQVHPGKTYRFGKVHIQLADTQPPDIYDDRQTITPPK